MKPSICLAVMFSLSGCGTTPYAPPTAGATAKINFINYASRNWELALYDRSQSCKRRRQISVLTPPNQVEQTVLADTELTFQFYLTNFGDQPREEYCLVNLRFVPRSGSRYAIRAEEGAGACKWSAYDVTNVATPEAITLTRVPWKAGFSENSSFCEN
jgi:hypothetical protein